MASLVKPDSFTNQRRLDQMFTAAKLSTSKPVMSKPSTATKPPTVVSSARKPSTSTTAKVGRSVIDIVLEDSDESSDSDFTPDKDVDHDPRAERLEHDSADESDDDSADADGDVDGDADADADGDNARAKTTSGPPPSPPLFMDSDNDDTHVAPVLSRIRRAADTAPKNAKRKKESAPKKVSASNAARVIHLDDDASTTDSPASDKSEAEIVRSITAAEPLQYRLDHAIARPQNHPPTCECMRCKASRVDTVNSDDDDDDDDDPDDHGSDLEGWLVGSDDEVEHDEDTNSELNDIDSDSDNGDGDGRSVSSNSSNSDDVVAAFRHRMNQQSLLGKYAANQQIENEKDEKFFVPRIRKLAKDPIAASLLIHNRLYRKPMAELRKRTEDTEAALKPLVARDGKNYNAIITRALEQFADQCLHDINLIRKDLHHVTKIASSLRKITCGSALGTEYKCSQISCGLSLFCHQLIDAQTKSLSTWVQSLTLTYDPASCISKLVEDNRDELYCFVCEVPLADRVRETNSVTFTCLRVHGSEESIFRAYTCENSHEIIYLQTMQYSLPINFAISLDCILVDFPEVAPNGGPITKEDLPAEARTRLANLIQLNLSLIRATLDYREAWCRTVNGY